MRTSCNMDGSDIDVQACMRGPRRPGDDIRQLNSEVPASNGPVIAQDSIVPDLETRCVVSC